MVVVVDYSTHLRGIQFQITYDSFSELAAHVLLNAKTAIIGSYKMYLILGAG
jgi:hypothetical protein